MSTFDLTPGDFQQVAELVFTWAIQAAEKRGHVQRVHYPSGEGYYDEQGRLIGKQICGEFFIPIK